MVDKINHVDKRRETYYEKRQRGLLYKQGIIMAFFQ